MSSIRSHVQVNIPFRMLVETHMERFVTEGLNPEIGLDADALDRFDRSDFEAAAGELLAAGARITLHAPFMDLSPGSPDPRIRAVARERFEQVLALAPLFRPAALVCHTGYSERRYGHMQSAWLEQSLSLWEWVSDGLRAAGAGLMIENVYEAHPGELRPLLAALGVERARFCLDTGHLSAFGGRGVGDWLAVLGPFVGQVHLHDNRGGQDEHLAPGAGRIDFAPLFDYLAKMSGKRPIITLEPHRESDLAPALAYLEEAWPWPLT